MEKEVGLLEAGVVNQPLPSEEEMEEASKRSTLAISDPKETAHVESYEGPSRAALEEVVAEKQPEMVEKKKKKKKKKKIKEKRAKGDEEAYLIKKKERKTSETKECRREENRLKKKGEKRKRAESPEIGRESTTTRVDERVSARQKESAQPEEETTQIRMIVTDDGEDSDITPPYAASQGSTIDLPILQSAVEEKERRRREEEEKQEKMLRAQQIIAEGDLRRKLHGEEVHYNNAISVEEERIRLEEEQNILLVSEQFEREFDREMRVEEEEEKKKKEEKENRHQANVQRIREKKGKEIVEWEKEVQCKERERKKKQRSRLALTKEKGKAVAESSEPALAKGRPSKKKENDDMMMEMGFFPAPTTLLDLITSVVLEHE
ncbi:vicilin-like seed storage protein At2g18540 [Benincasa hispida]|uniref:vicilin-like seed storage protein At2g18540 n=1 Tax=Benincasa hispida TaxID=102211 RepID=UPI001901124B|nr:vicilin-like seed storage protein At2g18540 [Benincasa hispida]